MKKVSTQEVNRHGQNFEDAVRMWLSQVWEIHIYPLGQQTLSAYYEHTIHSVIMKDRKEWMFKDRKTGMWEEKVFTSKWGNQKRIHRQGGTWTRT